MTAQDANFVSSDEGTPLKVFADTIMIKLPSERTKGSVLDNRGYYSPGAGAPPDVHHREDEMFYVLEGEYEFRCGDRVFKATKGGLVALPRDIPHAFKNTGNTPGKTLLFLIPGGTEKAFEEVSRMPPGPPDIGKVNTISMKYGVEFLPMY
jgi:mannose-6-phosphate isomerase-like protein (cupin superfamily)